MIQTSRLSILIFLGALPLLQVPAHAATVWNGPTITFSNGPAANPTLPQNQDHLTPNVWITRGSTEGIFNIAKENSFTKFFSPADTAWSYGALSDYASLTYTDWEDWFGGPVGGGPIVTVGKPAVVHLTTFISRLRLPSGVCETPALLINDLLRTCPNQPRA